MSAVKVDGMEQLGAAAAERVGNLLSQFSEFVDTSQWKNIGLNEGGFLVASVPMSQIAPHDFPINPMHSSSLAGQMREAAEETGGSGQRLPIDLATVVGQEGLHITDGFHRHDGAEQNEYEYIHAVLTPNLTFEELIDERIAATRRGELEISRTVEITQQAWEITPWSGKLDVIEAFQIVARGSNGKMYGLSTDERAELASWMKTKTARWGLSVKEVLKFLEDTDGLDPVVTKNIQTLGKSGDRGFTPGAAKMVVGMFSQKIGDEIQIEIDYVNLIAETANRLELSLPQTRELANRIYDIPDYDRAAAFCTKYIPPAAKKRFPSNSSPSTGKNGSSTSVNGGARPKPTGSGVSSDDETAFSLDAYLDKSNIQGLVAFLLKGVGILHARLDQQDTELDETEAAQLHAVGSLLLGLAGNTAAVIHPAAEGTASPNTWGYHKGDYNGDQVRDAIRNIASYIASGDGNMPDLPSILDVKAKVIIQGVKSQFTGSTDAAINNRLDALFGELNRRFAR